MIIAIVTAWLAYSRAKANGRNGWLWGLAGAAVFIGTQLAVSFGAGVLIGLGIVAMDWPEDTYETMTWPITAVAIVASIGASWALLKYLDRMPVETAVAEPPPPPSFGSGQ